MLPPEERSHAAHYGFRRLLAHDSLHKAPLCDGVQVAKQGGEPVERATYVHDVAPCSLLMAELCITKYPMSSGFLQFDVTIFERGRNGFHEVFFRARLAAHFDNTLDQLAPEFALL